MAKVVSCGVLMLNARRELFVCHVTGTTRWDLPKGLQDPGESAVQTALREVWEETSLVLEPQTLEDLGLNDYLPAKRLHLFASRVAVDAFRIDDCRCHTSFPHHATGAPTLEVDAYAWKPLDRLDDWCGKNMTRVLLAIDGRASRGWPKSLRCECVVRDVWPSSGAMQPAATAAPECRRLFGLVDDQAVVEKEFLSSADRATARRTRRKPCQLGRSLRAPRKC